MIALFVLATIVFDPALARLGAEDARVASIGWRLQTANVALCADTVPISGLSLHAISQYQPHQRAAAAAMFALGDYPGIAAVATGSAADRAGLRAGDAILSVAGQPFARIAQNAGYAPVSQAEDLIDAALRQAPATLRTSRGDFDLTADRGCASRFQIVAGASINAAADGRYVQINAKMLDFVQSDDELATVMAHELAHNILRHRSLKTSSKQAEYAADRLGVWLMARAGFDAAAVVPFWARFEKRTNAGLFAAGTHPSPRKRLAAVAEAVRLLEAQRARGESLLPPAR